MRVLEVDEPTAKAAILGLNRDQRPVRELEEAWVVQGLVRDDGMTQVEAAHLLGRHKSLVCRRLALLEKLSMAVKEDLRLGLVGPSLARQLTRLPTGNQEALLALTRRATLTAQEVSGVIDLLQGASPEQAAFVLAQPRAALARVHGLPTALRDPRLSRAGNWLAKYLTQALEALVRVENWLRTPNERELRAPDREIVQPLLAHVGEQARVVAELVLGPDLKRAAGSGMLSGAAIVLALLKVSGIPFSTLLAAAAGGLVFQGVGGTLPSVGEYRQKRQTPAFIWSQIAKK